MQWLAAHIHQILGDVALVCTVAVAILQQLHKTSVAQDIQELEDLVNKVNPPATPTA